MKSLPQCYDGGLSLSIDGNIQYKLSINGIEFTHSSKNLCIESKDAALVHESLSSKEYSEISKTIKNDSDINKILTDAFDVAIRDLSAQYCQR